MKFGWTVAGDDPDFAIGDRHGINGYFWPMFDPLTTSANLQDTLNRGYACGVYLVTNWPQFAGKAPAQIAKTASDEYKRLKIPKLRVQFDDERHEPDAIASVLEAWRELHPHVGTSWTMEGMQGGWMGPILDEETLPSRFIQRVLACRVRVVPQAYAGDMTDWDPWAVAKDLAVRGFPLNIISPFYDAANLPYLWDGYAFTVGRLPQ